MINSLECLSSLDTLKTCLASLHAGCIKEASRLMNKFRLPGEWNGERLHLAHQVAVQIRDKTMTFPDSEMRHHILRKVAQMIEMRYHT